MDFKLLRIAFALLLPLLWVEGVWAEDCPDKNYDLKYQREVDALGETGCTTVRGRLSIWRSSDITSLDRLINLTSVEGYMDIGYTDVLTNLDGLDNLTSISGGLYIGENAVLSDLNGLANLTSVGDLYLVGNPALTNLNGLERLARISRPDGGASEGKVYIYGNSTLANLDGLANLSSVDGDLSLRGNRALANCKLIAPLLGWPDGPSNDNVLGFIGVDSNATGCNSIEEILDSYSDALPEIVALRLMNTSQGFLGSSSEDTDKEIPPAAREAPAKDTQDPQEPNAIPTLPMLGLFILSGLLGLLGIRRLAHR
jgi:hypothetical protein